MVSCRHLCLQTEMISANLLPSRSTCGQQSAEGSFAQMSLASGQAEVASLRARSAVLEQESQRCARAYSF